MEFTKEDQILLFGDSDCTAAFQELDKDDDGEVYGLYLLLLFIYSHNMSYPAI